MKNLDSQKVEASLSAERSRSEKKPDIMLFSWMKLPCSNEFYLAESVCNKIMLKHWSILIYIAAKIYVKLWKATDWLYPSLICICAKACLSGGSLRLSSLGPFCFSTLPSTHSHWLPSLLVTRSCVTSTNILWMLLYDGGSFIRFEAVLVWGRMEFNM